GGSSCRITESLYRNPVHRYPVYQRRGAPACARRPIDGPTMAPQRHGCPKDGSLGTRAAPLVTVGPRLAGVQYAVDIYQDQRAHFVRGSQAWWGSGFPLAKGLRGSGRRFPAEGPGSRHDRSAGQFVAHSPSLKDGARDLTVAV